MSEGLEGFGGRDLVIPQIDMTQNTSKDISGLKDSKTGAAVEQGPGLFVDKKSAVSYGKKLNVVMLKAEKKRTLFFDTEGKKTPDDKGKRGRKCWSYDGITPAAAVPDETRQAESCEDCEFSNKDLEYHLLFLDTERSLEESTPVVFKLIAKGTSLGPVRGYISPIVQRKKAARDFSVTLSSVKSQNRHGNFMVLSFTGVNQVEDPELQAIVEEAFLTHCEATAPVDDDNSEQSEASRF